MSVPFTLTTLQVPKLALIDTKRIIVLEFGTIPGGQVCHKAYEPLEPPQEGRFVSLGTLRTAPGGQVWQTGPGA
jgi:hypothetical protein